jgi:hypothetical protein
MNAFSRRIALSGALALAVSGASLADNGDNSMSPYTGESYAAFNGGSVVETWVYVREAPMPDVIIGLPREYGNPFRDDTAA